MIVMKVTYRIGSCLVLLLALLLTACTADDSNGSQGNERRLQVSLATNAYQNGGGVTRGLPTGYEPLTVSTAFPNGKDLYAFFTHTTNASEVYVRRLEYQTDWQKNITITDISEPYCIYGFVPISDDTSDNVSINLLSGKTSYADGVEMTVNNLKPLTVSDPCVIVGVKDYGTATSIADVDVKLGAFTYSFSADNTYDRICMLLDHLFASVRFNIAVDEGYAALRTIKLKTMTLSTSSASVKATVTLTSNTTGANPVDQVSYTTAGAGTASATFFESNTGIAVTAANAEAIKQYYCCFAPSLSNALTLTSTYDVYDKTGTKKIRANCTASNKLPSITASRGERVTYDLTIKPTYLYQLSDPDLDNPTVVVN